ncbi:MAG: 4-alpha-glucanotransferase [Thermoleophilia bacterium]|nr:4-alpha-glucanotransferase [Thermoleophilia bacterium]
MDDHLRHRAETLGITLGYHDAMGVWREPPDEVVHAICEELGDPDASTTAIVVRPGAPRALPGDLAGATVRLEDGGEAPAPPELPGGLPEGYHAIAAADGRRVPLIVTPDTAYLPPALAGGGRMWGIAVQLYALRGERSWGMGDLGDLADLPAALGGPDFVLVNPLHAPTPGPHQEPSPYFASSRKYRNPLHLALDRAPEVALLHPEARARFDRIAADGRELSRLPRIDRDRIWALKREALAILAAACDAHPERRAALDAFGAADPELERYTAFCALAERHGGGDWRAWPADGAHDPAAARVHAYAQMLADEQLAALPPMSLGLMTDLAVGAQRGGYDAWAHRHVVSTALRVGCPPDQLGPEGQDWGVPPLLPGALAREGHVPFREMIRSAMRHAGGLRIDHVMGLSRLFVMPEGATALEGTYMRMPLDDLLGILCLESRRAECLVVGEDLGTVEEGFRERLAERGLLSYRLAWFEDRPAAEYPRTAMAATTTHDLPTVAGFFSGEDIGHLQAIGANAPELLRRIADAQPAERQRLRERLDAEGIEGAWSDDPEELTTALHTLLSRTPSMLACASLDDVAGAVMRANVPGTVDQHDNWRIPLPVTLEELAASPRTARTLAPLRDRPAG